MVRRGLVIGSGLVLAAGLATGIALSVGSGPDHANQDAAPRVPASGISKLPPPQVCGSAALRSPFHYDGAAGPYRSGVAGLPTYGSPGTDFPRAKAGEVLSGSHEYLSYNLRPHTVYYILPGSWKDTFQADTGDVFVGGYAHGKSTILNGNYAANYPEAIDSNSTNGDQADVTIEYLTIEKYTPDVNASVVNHNSNSDWTIKNNTISLNVPGAGVIAGTGNVLQRNCMTQNGQYGFQSVAGPARNGDSLTSGPYNVTVVGNEISYNDTCDLEGTITNPAAGMHKYNPVPRAYRNSHCGHVTPGGGNQGGFKLWETNGVTVKDNYIHNNYGPGGWADTNNANTTWTGNYITNNDSEGIAEEISYNFSITNNYLAGNDVIAGLGNPGFPSSAIWIAASGSDTTFGGVPACAEATCRSQPSYSKKSVISGNVMTNNGGGVFLWQDSNRYCSDSSDSACTLVKGGPQGPFTISNCRSNWPSAKVRTADYAGEKTGSPEEDWWDGCMWKTANVSVTGNTTNFTPSEVLDCNSAAFPACGATGIFAEYGAPPNKVPGWVIPTALTFFQGNSFAGNTYNGPTTFDVWNQGSGDNPVSWESWSGSASRGVRCSSAGERHSGGCKGPFGQDAGGTFNGSAPSA